MPRQSKNIIPWFKHDCESGRTLAIIEKMYQQDGYCLLYKLLEFLGKTENHFINMNEVINIQYLSEISYLTQTKCFEILNKFAELDFIDKELWEEKIIWCENFVSRLKEFYAKSNKILPKKPSIKPITNSVPIIPNNTTKQELVNLNHPDNEPRIPDNEPRIPDNEPRIPDNEDSRGVNRSPLEPPLLKNKIKELDIDIEKEIPPKRGNKEKEIPPHEINLFFSKENILKILSQNPKIQNGQLELIAENYILNRQQNQLNYKTQYWCSSTGIEIKTEPGLLIDLELWVNREIKEFTKKNKNLKHGNESINERYDNLKYSN